MREQFFLGVGRSAAGKAWHSRLDAQAERTALEISQRCGIADMAARVLAGRGAQAADAAQILRPRLRDSMPEPYGMADMERAAERLFAACQNKETIAVFSDYDVDGACSAALLARFLGALGCPPQIHIPDRQTEGYGPNEAALRRLAEAGASLIICADCGANSGELFAKLRQSGMAADIIVLDHHQTAPLGDSQSFGDFIHVNPNRPDDTSGLGILCAAGVVYMCLVAVRRLVRASGAEAPDLLPLLDLAALATVCDIVPLRGLNRAFVSQGLAVARQGQNIGLSALAAAARVNAPLAPYHFGYILGPRLNAGGRIGDSAMAVKLLCATDSAEAERLAAQLDSLNFSRQELEAAQLREAAEQAERLHAESGAAELMIFACGDWHIGLVGLLAARLRERFSLPAFVMAARGEGRLSGSARSVPGLDIGRLVSRAVAAGILETGGGHAAAAGFSLKETDMPRFRAFLAEELLRAAESEPWIESLEIDGSISASGVSAEAIAELEQAGPYGAGWEKPLFAVPNHTLSYVQPMGKDGAHLRAVLTDAQGSRLSAVLFRAAGTPLGDFLQSHAGKQAHIAGNLELNHWNGQTTPQLHILDAAPAE